MEPKTSPSQLGPENIGSYAPPSLEMHGYDAPEQANQRRVEVPVAQEQSTPSLPPPIVPSIATVEPTSVSATTPVAAIADDTPPVAADDDVIEKEWVDKAKKIIAETKDDPYRREQEVSRLQADYLSKRYGHELGEAA